MTWPGKDADDWWDSLTPWQKEAYHRWLTQRRPADDLPEHQLELTALLEEEPMALTPGEHAGTKDGRRDEDTRTEEDELRRRQQTDPADVEPALFPESKAWPPGSIETK